MGVFSKKKIVQTDFKSVSPEVWRKKIPIQTRSPYPHQKSNDRPVDSDR